MTRQETIESLVKNVDDTEVVEEYFEFLDWLRESGQTNMYGATPYLSDEFGIDSNRASEVLNSWMESFGK